MKETHGIAHSLGTSHGSVGPGSHLRSHPSSHRLSVLAAGRRQGLVLCWQEQAKDGGDTLGRGIRAPAPAQPATAEIGPVSRKGGWLWLSHRQ